MLEAKPISSPTATSTNLSAFVGDPIQDVTLYRSTVGALQYLALTRPDKSFIVNRLAQFMLSPKIEHWQSIKRFLHYLKQTFCFGLQIYHSHTHSLQAFLDADWVGCHDDRCSIGGFLHFFWVLI